MDTGSAPPIGRTSSLEPREPGSFNRVERLRRVVGEELGPKEVTEIGHAIAAYLSGSGTVALARDLRASSEPIARVLAGTLLLQGVHVRDLGALPTPAHRFNVKALGADLGVMVTGGDRPGDTNGLELTGPDGAGMYPAAARTIQELVEARKFTEGSWDRLGTYRRDPDGLDRYLRSVLEHVAADPIRSHRFSVVLDVGHGPGILAGPALLRELGCRSVTLHAEVDGQMSGRIPDLSEPSLALLKRAVLDSRAALGVAFDGDAAGVAFVDERGELVPHEVVLALLTRMRLAERPDGLVVSSVLGGLSLRNSISLAEPQLELSEGGPGAIGRTLLERTVVFAGEPDGQYYWPEHLAAPDGPMTMAKMLELLATAGLPLSGLSETVPRTYHARLRSGTGLTPVGRPLDPPPLPESIPPLLSRSP
jgi:phosphomannomutase / phosphoglucomutase